MNIWLPFRGEFGSKLMWHVPIFHRAPGPKVACHEIHQECLYPSADEHYIVESPVDPDYTGALGAPGDDEVYEKCRQAFPGHNHIHPLEVCQSIKTYFQVKPIKTYDLSPDVVLCRRMKNANPMKIWFYWDWLGEQLTKLGLSVYYADNFNTDEIAWAMLHTKLVFTVQTGSMFLCQYVGVHPHILCTKDLRECNGSMLVHERLLKDGDVCKKGWSFAPYFNNPDGALNYIVEQVCPEQLSSYRSKVMPYKELVLEKNTIMPED